MKKGEDVINIRFFIFPRKLPVQGTNRKEWRIGKQKVLEYCMQQVVPDLHPRLWPLVCVPLEWVEEK